MLNNPRPRQQAEFVKTERMPGESDGGSPAVESGTRREHSRFRVELDVTVTSEHNFYAGFVENMSVGGIFIATHQLKPVGELLEFSVNLPGVEAPIRGKGHVRWVRVYSESSNTPPGMGLQFESLDANSLQAIEGFLAQREPLFFDDASLSLPPNGRG
jgi:type IV pilus assembly protein PilZ